MRVLARPLLYSVCHEQTRDTFGQCVCHNPVNMHFLSSIVGLLGITIAARKLTGRVNISHMQLLEWQSVPT